MTVAIVAGTRPIPKKSTHRNEVDGGGDGLHGVENRPQHRFHPRSQRPPRRPSGIPIATEISTAMAIRARVSMVTSHKPDQAGIESSPRRPPMPTFHSPLRATTRKTSIGKTNQGSHRRKSSTAARAPFTAAVIGMKEVGEQRVELSGWPGPRSGN